jgi:hypothetical protein
MFSRFRKLESVRNAIPAGRPKRISCELPKGSQLFYASIATAAKALCCRGLAAFDFGQGSFH